MVLPLTTRWRSSVTEQKIRAVLEIPPEIRLTGEVQTSEVLETSEVF
jgi:hypothetical protein